MAISTMVIIALLVFFAFALGVYIGYGAGIVERDLEGY